MKGLKMQPEAQLRMPGMPKRRRGRAIELAALSPGIEVEYIGKVGGGPRYGATGVVREKLSRRALVDMGVSGRWLVPYYFLDVPSKAA